MEVGILIILKGYAVFVIFVSLIYLVRHYIFTLNRVFGEQKMYYQDIIESDYPSVTVFVSMHNEEKVAKNVLELLVKCDYPQDKLSIIPINDHSTDKTKEILDSFAAKHPIIKPLHRTSGERGKAVALNDGMALTDHEIMMVFDADYLPPKGILKDIAVCFINPEVGAVMGRVVPINVSTNLLTRMLDIERAGGYQVDQQARYNMRLIAQYGGTVGGFRRKEVLALGGFNHKSLTEDTELTFKLYLDGWKVVYANRVECYEEAPEAWPVRARQITRWSRGHNQVMFNYFWKFVFCDKIQFREKVDGVLLLFIYAMPFVLMVGMANSIALFFLGESGIFTSASLISLFLVGCSTFGNYAPFYEIGLAVFLDGANRRLRLLPLLIFNFFFNMFYTSKGFVEAFIDVTTGRATIWQKTERFRKAAP